MTRGSSAKTGRERLSSAPVFVSGVWKQRRLTFNGHHHACASCLPATAKRPGTPKAATRARSTSRFRRSAKAGYRSGPGNGLRRSTAFRHGGQAGCACGCSGVGDRSPLPQPGAGADTTKGANDTAPFVAVVPRLPRSSARDAHFFEQLRSRIDLLHDPAQVASVYGDHPRHLRIEHPVGADRLPVAVKGQSNKLALRIQNR